MDPSIAFAVGGILGSSLKAVSSNDQTTFSRKSIVDIAIGGLVGILLPLFPLIPIPKDASMVQQMALVAAIAYFTGDLAVNFAQKLGFGSSPQK